MTTTRQILLISTALAAWIGMSASARAQPAPVLNYGTQPPARNGEITVRPGDTIEKIGHLYRLPADQIAALNHLHKPYNLTPGKHLLLPMPREYVVGRTDTLKSVARMYGVPARAIAETNHLKSPYALRPGQALHIPTAEVQAAAHAEVASKVIAKPAAPAPTVSAQAAPPVDDDHVRLLKKPGPSLFSSMVSRIAGDKDAKAKAAEAATAPSILRPPAPPVAAPEPVVTASRRAGFIWPVKGVVISSYGPKDGGMYNDGINIAAPRGTPVLAAADGVVAYVGNTLQSYGNLVLIRHNGGMITAYAHLNAVNVRTGAHVTRGQPIGSVGSTGTVAHAQLHFEVRHGTDTIDPQQYLG